MSSADELIRKRAAKTLSSVGSEAANQAPTSEGASKSDRSSTGERASGCRLRRLDEFSAEKVEWIWTGRLPRGKVVIIEGHPGVGKSTLTAAIAAAVTAGVTLADQSVGRTGDVVFLTYEDGLEDTILPRVLAAGGDASRILIPDMARPDGYPAALAIPSNLAALELQLEIEGIHPDLVVIDPLSAALTSDIDSYRDQDVRRALAQVAAFAARTGACVVLVRHLKKQSSGKAITRGAGSIGIGAAARIVLGVYEHPENPDLRLLASVKTNITRHAATLAFEIVSSADADVSLIRWLGEESWSAQEIEEHQAFSAPRKANPAHAWLASLLSDGPLLSRDVHRLGQEEGFSKSKIERAAVAIQVVKKTAGYAGDRHSLWALPDRTLESRSSIPPSTPSAECNESNAKSSISLISPISPNRITSAIPSVSSPGDVISKSFPVVHADKMGEVARDEEMPLPVAHNGDGVLHEKEERAPRRDRGQNDGSNSDTSTVNGMELRALSRAICRRGLGLSLEDERLILYGAPGDLVSDIEAAKGRLVGVLKSDMLSTAFGRPEGFSQSPIETARTLWLRLESDQLSADEQSRLSLLEERRSRRGGPRWEARMLALEDVLRERER